MQPEQRGPSVLPERPEAKVRRERWAARVLVEAPDRPAPSEIPETPDRLEELVQPVVLARSEQLEPPVPLEQEAQWELLVCQVAAVVLAFQDLREVLVQLVLLDPREISELQVEVAHPVYLEALDRWVTPARLEQPALQEALGPLDLGE